MQTTSQPAVRPTSLLTDEPVSQPTNQPATNRREASKASQGCLGFHWSPPRFVGMHRNSSDFRCCGPRTTANQSHFDGQPFGLTGPTCQLEVGITAVSTHRVASLGIQRDSSECSESEIGRISWESSGILLNLVRIFRISEHDGMASNQYTYALFSGRECKSLIFGLCIKGSIGQHKFMLSSLIPAERSPWASGAATFRAVGAAAHRTLGISGGHRRRAARKRQVALLA
jgi:hypothetical protein